VPLLALSQERHHGSRQRSRRAIPLDPRADLVVRYEPEAPFELVRCFCGVCGTPLGEPDTNSTGFPIAAIALDDDPLVRTCLHEHVADKPAWYEITDDAPRFEGSPPAAKGSA